MRVLCLVNNDFYGPYHTLLECYESQDLAEERVKRLNENQKLLKKEYREFIASITTTGFDSPSRGELMNKKYKELVEKYDLIDPALNENNYLFYNLDSNYYSYELWEEDLPLKG